MSTETQQKTIPSWDLFTKAGAPVYEIGRDGFSLDRRSPGTAYDNFQARSYDETGRFRAKQLAKAEERLGVSCEWRSGKPTEVIDVSF